MAVTFFSGAETGDLSEWGSSAGSISAGTATVHAGKYALTSTTVGANVQTPALAGASTLFVRFYLQMSGLSASIAAKQMLVFNFARVGIANVALLYVTTDGSGNPSLNINNAISGLQVGGAAAFTTGVWHLIEWKIVISATVGVLEAKIDGTVVITGSSLNTGTNNVTGGGPNFTNNAGTGTPSGTVFWDDIIFNTTAYSGPGYCLARQFNTTAPNYDLWSKVGAANIWQVWDDTPFAAATDATQATSGNKQTGVVSFGNVTDTGATGHGADSVISTDIINAAKIGWVGKTSSTTTDGADSSVFRTPAGGAGVDTITASTVYTTADVYHETIFTTPTTAQILNCEAGISKGTGANTHTVEDVWLMIDTTPVRPPVRRQKRIAKPLVQAKRRRAPDHHPVAAVVTPPPAGSYVHRQRFLKHPFLRIPIPKPRPTKHHYWYPIGTPFFRIPLSRPRKQVLQQFKQPKRNRLRRIAYPIGMPFVRLARKAKALRPALRIRQPVRNRLRRILAYPIGAPFWRIPVKRPRILAQMRVKQPKRNRIRRIAYPVGMPFIRIARASRRLRQRVQPSLRLRPVFQHVRFQPVIVILSTVRRAGVHPKHIVIRARGVTKKSAHWLRVVVAAPVVAELRNNPLIKSLGKMMNRQ